MGPGAGIARVGAVSAVSASGAAAPSPPQMSVEINFSTSISSRFMNARIGTAASAQ